jgi:RNA polymerase subunit RPABC4/transcription elongation factor Spt4
MDGESLYCSNCETQIKNDDEYCPHCGLILLEEKKCYLHKENEAQGICLICLKLCCNKCGRLINNVFLCNEHNEYEIIEGMARVYGSNNSMEIRYYAEILEKEALHPFVYSRQSISEPFSLPTTPLFGAETNDYIPYELKLMMPLKEVLEAEKILEPLINDLG